MTALNAAFHSEEAARAISLFLWCAISAILLPSAWRCLRKRPRFIDPLLFAALGLTLNRITFGIQGYIQDDNFAAWCRWTSIVAASFYLFVLWDYQRGDRG